MKRLLRSTLIPVCLSGALAAAGCGMKGPLTMYPYEAPEQVSDLRALHRENVVSLSWSHPGNEKNFIKGFVVERADDGRTFMRIATLTPDVRSLEDRAIAAGNSYSYRVAAVSKRDRMSDEYALIRVAPKTLPQPPGALEAVATREGVEVRWTPVAREVLYNVYKSASPGKCGTALLNAQPVKEARFADSIDRIAVVYYCVRSLYGGDILDEGFPSSELAVMPSLYVPKAVEGLRGVASRQGVQLIWRESPEQWVQEYRIYRKGYRDADYRPVGTSLVPAYLDSHKASSPVSYMIEALGPVSGSPRSAAILVSPFQEP